MFKLMTKETHGRRVRVWLDGVDVTNVCWQAQAHDQPNHRAPGMVELMDDPPQLNDEMDDVRTRWKCGSVWWAWKEGYENG